MTTGTVLPVKPRSASHTSPGFRLIQHVQHFLLAGPGMHRIEDIGIGKFDQLGNTLANLGSRIRFSCAQSRFELFGQCIHR